LPELAQPRTFEDGASILRSLFAAQFPKVSPMQWLAAAHRAWRNDGADLKPTYDVRLALSLAGVDTEKPLPVLWKEFDTIVDRPMLVIRGANSDILSAETVEAMAARHPGMEVVEVPDQGHVPLFESELVQQVARFVAACEKARTKAGQAHASGAR
jgi:pimeloyl-ACP methyl ester carboxylesterase